MPLRQASSEAIVWSARRDSHFLETLRGIKAIKLFNGHENRRAHWLNLLVETANRQLTTQKMRLMLRTANSLLTGMLAILVVWFGLNLLLGLGSLSLTGDEQELAWEAHIGGFLAGLLLFPWFDPVSSAPGLGQPTRLD